MLRRSFRFGLLFGLLGGAVAAALKAVQGRTTSTPAPVAPAPRPDRPERSSVSIADLQEAPTPPKKKAAAPKPKKLEPWIDPVDGECPPTHPVKAKMSSKIYHLPGGFNYARTRPDRCYLDAAAAEADGLRPSKR